MTQNNSQPMNCMEVCGGHGSGTGHYQRPGLDVWVLSRVFQDVAAGGGDLHLISSCASGRVTRMLLADICGFGPLFHSMATRLRDVMKRNVNSITQARSVSQISRQLAGAAEQGGYASTLLSTYFAPTRSFSICNAGHPTPFLYRRSTREWSLWKHHPQPHKSGESSPGVVAHADYQQLKTRLELGDRVLCVSNSMAEARNPAGQTLGLEGLQACLRQLDGLCPSEIPQRLLDVVRQAHSDNLVGADTTIMLCEATETRVNWRDNLLAPFRLLGSVKDRTAIM